MLHVNLHLDDNDCVQVYYDYFSSWPFSMAVVQLSKLMEDMFFETLEKFMQIAKLEYLFGNQYISKWEEKD